MNFFFQAPPEFITVSLRHDTKTHVGTLCDRKCIGLYQNKTQKETEKGQVRAEVLRDESARVRFFLLKVICQSTVPGWPSLYLIYIKLEIGFRVSEFRLKDRHGNRTVLNRADHQIFTHRTKQWF